MLKKCCLRCRFAAAVVAILLLLLLVMLLLLPYVGVSCTSFMVPTTSIGVTEACGTYLHDLFAALVPRCGAVKGGAGNDWLVETIVAVK